MEEINQGKPDPAMTERPHLFVTGGRRLALWRKLRGMWKDRTLNPGEELENTRNERDRNLSSCNGSGLTPSTARDGPTQPGSSGVSVLASPPLRK